MRAMAKWQMAGCAARTFLLLFVFAATLSTANTQLLGADDCMIGYQYRSPPVSVTCSPNATVTRLDCWIALPTAPSDTRVEIRWYWRSLSGGSNTAYEVDNTSPFQYMYTPCDNPCPTLGNNNLTIDVSQLKIENFGKDLEGDYLCRVLVVNKTSGVVIQALQPSACARVRLNEDMVEDSCSVDGLNTSWQCATTEPSVRECPQQLSPAQPLPSSASYTRMTSVPAYSSGSHPMLSTAVPTPTSTDTRSVEQHITASYIYAPLCTFALLVLVGVGITAVVILVLQHAKEKKLSHIKALQKDGVFSDVLKTSEEKEGIGKGGSTLNRNSTIYSKPVWPAERQSSADNVKDHNYATIPGKHDVQRDSGAYSYAYQHRACPQVTTKPQEGKGNAKSAYQELGTVDYTQMYSRASPLLVGSTAVAGSRQGDYMHTYPRPSPLLAGSIAVAGSHNDVEEKGYQKLESTTLNAESVYTEPLQTPEKLG